MNKYFRLTHAVIASTLFMGPVAYADITINTPNTNRDTQTTVDGNITIASTGQLWMNAPAPNGGDGILVNSANAVITLNANNTVNVNCVLGTAICTTVGGGPGIDVSGAGGANSTAITVGAATNIVAAADGIYVDGPTTSINNSGNISSSTAGSAVEITLNGLNTGIYNFAGATLLGSTAPTILVNGQGANISNSGTITSNGLLDAVQLNQNFSEISNNFGGIIQALGSGSAIDITGGSPLTGSINNAGTITTTIGNGILIQNTLNGPIINSGAINVTGAGGTGVSIVSGFTAMSNSGTITAAAGSFPINVIANASGTIGNSGTIQANNEPAITLGGNITGISNTGTISVTNSLAEPVIVATAPVDLVGGITNSGTITNVLNGVAIDLSVANNVVLTQAAGTINGNVFLASLGGNIFNMTGGIIDGSVAASDVAPNIHTLSGGLITGNLILGDMGDTVNISGAVVDTITGGAGADTIIVSAGGFETLNAQAADILNISGSLVTTPSESITVGTIHLVSPAVVVNNTSNIFTDLLTLAPGSFLTNNAAITINPGGSIINDGYIDTYADINSPSITNSRTYIIENPSTTTVTGLFDNTGSLTINSTGQLIAGTYNQSPTGDFSPVIDAGSNGNILTGAVGGGDLQGTISPTFISGSYLQTGSTYDILTSGVAFTDSTTLNAPNSATLYFTKNLVGGGTILELTAQRRPYASIVTTQPGFGAAAELDIIAAIGTTNPTLLQLLGQLDLLENGTQLTDAMISLSPTVNYALVQGSHMSIDNVFSTLLYRVENMRNLKPLGAEHYSIYKPERRDYYTGINYGDDCSEGEPCRNNITGVWFEVYGNYLTQRTYKNLNGYQGDVVGYAIGADWGNPELAAVGLAGSYTNTHTVGQSEQANILNVESIQGTAYAWFEPYEGVFMDAMFGFASHKYNSRRNIGIGTLTTSAFADFYGLQYAVQTDLGYAFTYDFLIVAPMGRFKYSYLAVDSYTEDGAGGISLSVENKSLQEMIGGIGIKLLGHKVFSQARYIPEVSFMLLYDFDADGQETSSNFIGGGGLFPTTGPNPSHAIYQFAAGITAYTYDNYSFEFKYELDIRDRYHFYANNAFMRLRGEWG